MNSVERFFPLANRHDSHAGALHRWAAANFGLMMGGNVVSLSLGSTHTRSLVRPWIRVMPIPSFQYQSNSSLWASVTFWFEAKPTHSPYKLEQFSNSSTNKLSGEPPAKWCISLLFYRSRWNQASWGLNVPMTNTLLVQFSSFVLSYTRAVPWTIGRFDCWYSIGISIKQFFFKYIVTLSPNNSDFPPCTIW